jgi:hypothetical protein
MFCAICTEDLAPDAARPRPLGRGGAIVSICASCDEEHPNSGRYSFDGGRDKSSTGLSPGAVVLNIRKKGHAS